MGIQYMSSLKQKNKIVIHAALDRKALCAFSTLDPSKWPKMNWWVKATSKKYKGRVTCKSCLKSMKKL